MKKEKISKNLIDFSYIIHQRYGIVYYVTDYHLIELLVKELKRLEILRLYIIGCLNTTVDGNRLEKNLFQHLNHLEEFHFYLQSYGGKSFQSMEQFRLFQWDFASYTDSFTDMHYLFTIPYTFTHLDQCFNQYFYQGIRTTFNR